jgi:adenine-specific DNA-methyltransferase
VDPTSKTPPTNWKARAKQHAARIAALETEIANLKAMLDRRIGLCWEPPSAATYEADAARRALPLRLRLDPSLSLPAHDRGNLILEGDNLLALRLLARTHRGRIDAIFIDPPYNTGSTSWVYNDQRIDRDHLFRHSLWLDFLAQRLAIARDLLSPTGILAVCIGDETRWLLEGLLEQLMPGRRIGSLVWRSRQGANDPDHGLSVDHEHILLYGGHDMAEIRLGGVAKTFAMYSNPDQDPRGDWRPSDLTAPKTFEERPLTYYPLLDPTTGYWYPCNPDRVWAFASERLTTGKTRKNSMEQHIREGRVLFPKNPRTAVWATLDDLLAAIDAGDVPTSGKGVPLLRRGLPGLEFFVGKTVAWGTPRLKRFKAELRSETQAFSSWIRSTADKEAPPEDRRDAVVGTTAEGTAAVNAWFGEKVFDYPKPPSLVREVLRQITTPSSLVLDFFAGSGTTAEAVLALNAEDDGDRRFILVSNTEADAKNPEKNLCRDVCRERVRRVIQADAKAPPKGKRPVPHADCFAYVRLDLVPPEEGTLADAAQDPHTAWAAIQIAAGAPVMPWPDGQDLAVVRLPSREDIPERWVAYAPRWSAQIGKAIEALDGPGTLWTDRPGQARQALAKRPDVAVEDAPKTLEAWLAPVEPFVR